MSVWYLELDDEITDAVARLRAAKDDRVVLVVPPGSRIGTGRINFRLLAREAETRGLALALVSGDAQVRALAASAGLDVYATVSASEAIEAPDAVAGGPTSGATEGAAVVTTTGGAATVVATTRSTAPGPSAAPYPGARPRTDAETAKTTAARRQRRRRMAILGTGAAVVLLAASGGLYGAYVTIPTASIVLEQTDRDLEPVALILTVDADQPTDVALGRIEGQRLPIAVQREVVVPATGVADPESERARGQVTFSNHSPNPIRVPDQTELRTETFVWFETQGGIVVPAGGSMDAEIRAVVAGLGGNVDAGAITVMPPELRDSMINGTVTNKEPTTGGDTVPTFLVTQGDWDSAVADLTSQLQADLTVQAGDPEGLPEGDLVYPSTVAAGTVITDPPENNVIGQPVATTVIGSLGGTVLTASATDIDDVANQRLRAAVPAGTTIVDGSIKIALGEPAIDPDGVVSYQSTATGRAYVQTLNKAQIKDSVRGKTIVEARARLEEFGTVVDITLSPDWMPTLPDDPNRIELNITPRRTPPP